MGPGSSTAHLGAVPVGGPPEKGDMHQYFGCTTPKPPQYCFGDRCQWESVKPALSGRKRCQPGSSTAHLRAVPVGELHHKEDNHRNSEETKVAAHYLRTYFHRQNSLEGAGASRAQLSPISRRRFQSQRLLAKQDLAHSSKNSIRRERSKGWFISPQLKTGFIY